LWSTTIDGRLEYLVSARTHEGSFVVASTRNDDFAVLQVISENGKSTPLAKVKPWGEEGFLPWLPTPWGAYLLFSEEPGSTVLGLIGKAKTQKLPPPPSSFSYVDIAPDNGAALLLHDDQPIVAVEGISTTSRDPNTVSLSAAGIASRTDVTALFEPDGGIWAFNLHQVASLDRNGSLRWTAKTTVTPNLSASRRLVAVRDTEGLRVLDTAGNVVWQGGSSEDSLTGFSPDDRWFGYKQPKTQTLNIVNLESKATHQVQLKPNTSALLLNSGVVALVGDVQSGGTSVSILAPDGKAIGSYQHQGDLQVFALPDGGFILVRRSNRVEGYSLN